MTAAAPLPVLVSTGSVPLTPAQSRFNTLVRQIAQARETLAAWQAGIDAFRAAHARHIAPLEAELDRVRRERVRTLDALSHRSGLARLELDTLSGLIARETQALLRETPEDAELVALFAAHAGADLRQAEADVGRAGADADSAGADVARAQQSPEGTATAPQDEDDGRGTTPPPRPPRRSAAQRKRDADALEALQSVREVYRKLASALHPDREPDASKRDAKTALMQRVNQAYEARDLLALLELQRESEQVDLTGLANADTQRLKRYNAVFADQLASLKAAARDMEAAFCASVGLRGDLMLNPRKLDPLIRALRAELQALIRAHTLDRRQLADLDGVRRWLKEARRRSDDA